MAEIEKAIIDYAEKARSGNVDLKDLTGGTFSITNGGVFGSMMSTPILNPPQSGILGLHRIQNRPIEDPDNPGTTLLQPVPVDEVTMETVALATGGEFYSTDSFTDLADVYRDIGTALAEEPIREDLHEQIMGFALIAAALTATLSLLWFQRLP